MTGEKNKYNNFAPKNIEEAIKAVEKFNQENKYRDGGYINSSINMVLKENEELKEKNEILREELKSKIEALDIAMSNPDYICKDKINELIKEPTIITSDGDYISVKKVKRLLEED